MFSIACRWMDERSLSLVVSISDQWAFEKMFETASQIPHAYCNACTVGNAPNALSACVASVCVLSFCQRPQRDDVIHTWVWQHCKNMRLPLTTLRDRGV